MYFSAILPYRVNRFADRRGRRSLQCAIGYTFYPSCISLETQLDFDYSLHSSNEWFCDFSIRPFSSPIPLYHKSAEETISLPIYCFDNSPLRTAKKTEISCFFMDGIKGAMSDQTSNPAYFSTSSEKMEFAQANHSRLNSYSLLALMLSCMK